MYTVYKITNLINNKCYIGSSSRVEKRWQQHKNDAFNINNNQYNYPLYQAFRKYKIENFKFEILKNDFQNREEMENYEHLMIIYYNSLSPCGYNQTLNTQNKAIASENTKKYITSISQKCALVDKNENILQIFKSYHEAAEALGYDRDSRATSVRRVCKGEQGSLNGLIFRDLDENNKVISKPIKSPHGRKKIIAINVYDIKEKIIFNSITEAAKNLNTDRASIGKCIKGDTRYSVVKGYIFRQLDNNDNIINNNINIESKIKEYQKRRG